MLYIFGCTQLAPEEVLELDKGSCAVYGVSILLRTLNTLLLHGSVITSPDDVALLILRFVARLVYLRKRRNMARPITRGRRWISMLLDVVAWLIAWGVLYAGFTIGYLMLIDNYEIGRASCRERV